MHLRPLLRTIDREKLAWYERYIESIRPRNNFDVLRRWLFAYCSIHTTWSNNVRAYLNLSDLKWLNYQPDICSRLRKSGAGLHNIRSNAIHDFSTKFFVSPNRFLAPRRRERRKLRDELNSQLTGIGPAKISFVYELIDPNCGAICLDRHMLKLMTGSMTMNGKMSSEQYAVLENKWNRACQDEDVHPVAARHYIWDRLQGKEDMRYWSHVFETTKV